MNIGPFQAWVRSRWRLSPRPNDLAIMTLGLVGEAGEVSEPIKKNLRGDGPVDLAALSLELGDVLHYAAAIADHYELSLETILEQNVAKIEARQAAKQAT